MKSISIASLNLHHFVNWQERYTKIVTLFKENNPDIILTQETQLDPQFENRNQIELLNDHLLYPYINFSPAETRTRQKGEELKFPIEHGLGILSKYPINNVEILHLKQEDESKENRIAVTYSIRIDNEDYRITNVHFTNNDDGSLMQFKQVIDVSTPETILTGDFNIHGFNFEKNRSVYEPKYISSYDFKKYISFPEENATFDYVLIPNTFQFRNVTSMEEIVSDHRMLLVEIVKKK